MKTVVLNIVLFFMSGLLGLEAYGQDYEKTPAYYLPLEENESWLLTLKSCKKEQQMSMIIDRLIMNNLTFDSIDNKCCSPGLVVDGVLVPTTQLSDSIAVELGVLLSQENIQEVAILDEVSKAVFCNPTFSGIVLLTLKNRKNKKQFKKLITDI